MAVEYLEKYIERVTDVPAELRRRFKLIRDLDERSAKLQTDLDEKCREQLVAAQTKAAKGTPAHKRPRASADDPLNAEIAAGHARLVSWAEEKVRILLVLHHLCYTMPQQQQKLLSHHMACMVQHTSASGAGQLVAPNSTCY